MHFIASKLSWLIKGEEGIAAAIQTIFSRSFILIINLVTGIITARLLGPEGRGEQSAIIFWPGMLATTFTLGLPTAIVYNFRRYPQKRSQLFASAMVLCLILGLIAASVGYLFLPSVLNKYSNDVIDFARIIVFTTIAILFCLVLYGAYEGIQQFSVSNKARTLVAVSTLLLLVLMALFGQLNSYNSSIAYLVIYIPVACWLLIRLCYLLKPSFRDLIPSSKLLIGYGSRSYGIDLFGAVSSQVNQALVVSALSPNEMGLFAISLSFSNMLHIFRTSIATVLLSKASAKPKDEVIAVTGQAARICGFLTFSAGLVAVLIAPQLVTLLYGAEFLDAVILFRISVFEVLLISMTLVLSQAFLALNKPGVITILQAIGLGTGVPLRLLFIPAYGLVGAGVAILLSTLIRFIFVLLCFPLILKTKPPSLLANKNDFLYIKERLLKSGYSV